MLQYGSAQSRSVKAQQFGAGPGKKQTIYKHFAGSFAWSTIHLRGNHVDHLIIQTYFIWMKKKDHTGCMDGLHQHEHRENESIHINFSHSWLKTISTLGQPYREWKRMEHPGMATCYNMLQPPAIIVLSQKKPMPCSIFQATSGHAWQSSRPLPGHRLIDTNLSLTWQ